MKEFHLSIIVAAFNNESYLEQCLKSLINQIDSSDTEIIVVSNFYNKSVEQIKKRYSGVKFIVLPEETNVPELRTRGINDSNGEIIALLEDHCIFDKQWCSEIKRAHKHPYSIIGGSVENASPAKALDWAVYFYDYGKYMLPSKAGEIDSLSGINISYKKVALEKVENLYKKGFFETFINEELKKQGKSLYMIPSAIVYHKKNYKLFIELL